MKVLLVERQPELAKLWARHLERLGVQVRALCSGEEAMDVLEVDRFDVMILDLLIEDASALAVADLASFRHPATRVVFVTNSSFFSDGYIF